MIVWQLKLDEDEAAALRAILERAVAMNSAERHVIRSVLDGDFGKRARRLDAATR